MGSKVYLAVPATVDLCAGLTNHRLQITDQPHEATVFVCDKPGESLPLFLQLRVGLQGLVEASPSFFETGTGCALKFNCMAKLPKVLLVSAKCAEKHVAFWATFRRILTSQQSWKIHKIQGTVAELQGKQQTYPKYKALVVIDAEEETALSKTDKAVYTIQTLLHRLRRADMAASCTGLLKA